MRILHIPSGQFIKLYSEGAKNEDGEMTDIIEDANGAKKFLKTHTKKQLLEYILKEFETPNSWGYCSVRQANGLELNQSYSQIEFKVYWRKDNVS